MENSNSWTSVIESMHQDTIEALKEIRPGTPEWKFCMRSLAAYETWYLGTKNQEEKFNTNDININ